MLLGQNFGLGHIGQITRNADLKYDSFTFNTCSSIVMAKVKVLRNVDQRSWSSSQGYPIRFALKGLH